MGSFWVTKPIFEGWICDFVEDFADVGAFQKGVFVGTKPFLARRESGSVRVSQGTVCEMRSEKLEVRGLKGRRPGDSANLFKPIQAYFLTWSVVRAGKSVISGALTIVGFADCKSAIHPPSPGYGGQAGCNPALQGFGKPMQGNANHF